MVAGPPLEVGDAMIRCQDCSLPPRLKTWATHLHAAADQRPQALEIDFVEVRSTAVFALWGFEDHRDMREACIVYEVRQALLADLALADVLVAVDPRTALAASDGERLPSCQLPARIDYGDRRPRQVLRTAHEPIRR